MANNLQTTKDKVPDRQRSEVHLRIGQITVVVSGTGLLATTALVSGTLLSTAVFVRSAVRESIRFQGWPR